MDQTLLEKLNALDGKLDDTTARLERIETKLFIGNGQAPLMQRVGVLESRVNDLDDAAKEIRTAKNWMLGTFVVMLLGVGGWIVETLLK